MKCYATFARRKFSLHVGDGIHASISPEAAKGVPTTNMHLERAFGYWDQKQRRVPAMSSLAVEACVLFTLNKTHDWLAA